MKSAVVTGMLAVISYLIMGLLTSRPDETFSYMSACSMLLSEGKLAVTPYFPMLYPMLLLVAVKLSLPAVTGAIVLNATGMGLTAASVVYSSRFWGLPVLFASSLGILAVSLPNVFSVGLSLGPDAIVLGLSACLVASLIHVSKLVPTTAVYLFVIVCGLMLCLLRYEAIFVIGLIGLILFNNRTARKLAVMLMLVTIIGTAVNIWLLNSQTGLVTPATASQIELSAAKNTQDSGTYQAILSDYPQWVSKNRSHNAQSVITNLRSNWVFNVTRKAILLGLVIFITAMFYRCRMMPGTVELLIILIVSTTVGSVIGRSATYTSFPEILGMILLAAGISALISPDIAYKTEYTGESKTVRSLGGVRSVIVLGLLLLPLIYNVYREVKIVSSQIENRKQIAIASEQMSGINGENRQDVLGEIGWTYWPEDKPYNLPASTFQMSWLTDPTVNDRLGEMLPVHRSENILSGSSPVRAILLWEKHPDGSLSEQGLKLIEQLERSYNWREEIGQAEGSRIWIRDY